MTAMRKYLAELVDGFGNGWNQFWFAPSDPATLSLMRIATGLIALYVVLSYTPDLDELFGPGGLASEETLANLEQAMRVRQLDPSLDAATRQQVSHQVREAIPRQLAFSYLNYLHSPGALRAAHWAGLAVLALFTAGLFTRAASVLALLVVLSYIHRGPLLTSHVEPILAFVMFYLCVGPSGAEWSIDRVLRARRTAGQPVQLSTVYHAPIPSSANETAFSSAATVSIRLIQVHLALLYSLMAIGKLASEVWWDGMAVWWLIARPESRLVDLTWLHRFPLLVSGWTYAVAAYHLAFPVLIWNRLARPLLLVLGVVLWGSLALLTGEIPFSLMMLVASLAFVPSEVARSWLPRCCSSEAAAPAV